MFDHQDLVIMAYTFATDAPHVRDVMCRETDNGLLTGACYPLDFHGMRKGRLNQFTLVNTVRKNAQSLTAVTVARKEDAIEQSLVFFKRVAKAKARLARKAERIATLKAEGNQRRAWVMDPSTGEYAEREFLQVKKGDRFYMVEPDGTRAEEFDRVALSNGFWTYGYIAGIIANPCIPQVE